MPSGYIVNVKPANKKKRRKVLLIIFIITIIIAVSIWLYFHYEVHANTKINQSKSITTTVTGGPSGQFQTYHASDFSFQMSPGWVSVPISNNPYTIYEWQTGKGAYYETVLIYENTIPTNFAVNHIIVLSPDGDKITALGGPSDNCANFTNGHITSSQFGYPAKWLGVAFNCDLNNPSRDTVGTTSAQAVNTVTLVSPTNVKRSFFFLYTDHTIQPNYNDFVELLNSFQLQ